MTPRLISAVLGLLVASTTLVACTSSPDPAPDAVAEPPAEITPSEPSWEPDLVVTRDYPDADGAPVECTTFLRVVAASENASDDVVAQVDAARAHLAVAEWTEVDVSLDDMPADEQESRRAQGVSDPELQTMILSGLIYDDLAANGFTGTGLAHETFVTCA